MSTYLVSKKVFNRLNNSISFGGFYINYSDETNIHYYSSDRNNIEVCIIGYCIDARGEISRESLPLYLSTIIYNSDFNWSVFIKETSRLAGDFVIAVSCSDYFRMISDATGRVGIYYDINGIGCSSSDVLLAEYTGSSLCPIAKKIRNEATGDGQALPNNITDYTNVYISLPNFYFDLSVGVSKRFFPSNITDDDHNKLSVEDCLSKSYNLISNIVKEYSKDHKLICPVTAGWDSRTNYSFFLNNSDLETFTFILPGFNTTTPDINIPKSYLFNSASHKIIKRLEAPDIFYKEIKDNVTPYPGNGSATYAYTLLTEYENPVFINGDIISHIGSSAIGLDLPEKFAHKSFFKCKLHNFSSEADLEIEKWIQSIHDNKYAVSLYDLFAWENRLGRWAHDRNKVMSSMGVKSLNIYNCREVLELWLQIPREQRNKENIQGFYISLNEPKLLDVPFNPKSRLGWVRNYKYAFLMASYGKYYFELLKRKLKND